MGFINKIALLGACFFVFTLCAHAQESPTDAPELNKGNWPTHLRMLTGPGGGQWNNMGDPIVNALKQDVLPATSRTGGGLANIDSINSRIGDIAFSLTCFLGAASSGEVEYQKIKLDNTVLLANIYPQVFYFLVRKDFAEAHKINTVDDLFKLRLPIRFASLKRGTASEFILSLLLEYGYHSNFDKLREQGWTISFSDYAETANNFVAGDLDCFAYSAGTEVPLILEMEKYVDITILPIDQSVLDILSDKFKTNTYIVKPGTYKNIDKPIATLGDYTCVVVRKDLPDDLVYAISRALWTHKADIAGAVKDFDALSPETAIVKGLPMHPGALQFWQELQAEQGLKN